MKTYRPTISKIRRKPLVSAIAACLALSAIPAYADDYTVINLANTGPGSLRQAILSANGHAGLDSIKFSPGLIDSTITLAGYSVGALSFFAQININDDLIIDASLLAGGITISGNNLTRIFGVTDASVDLTLKNITVTNGKTTVDKVGGIDCAAGSVFDPVTFSSGGAICAEGNITLIDSTISNSGTEGSNADGGGFYAAGEVSLSNSTISGNSTSGTDADGGGFFTNSAASLLDSVVSSNIRTGIEGRGAGFFAQGEVSLITSIISDNEQTNSSYDNFSTNDLGGGFFASGNVSLSNSVVSGNRMVGAGAQGGGFHCSGNVTLINSTISNNRVTYYSGTAGGFYARGNVSLNNSTVSNNFAYAGNGDAFQVRGEKLTLNNSTITENRSSYYDGGIFFNSIDFGGSEQVEINSTILSGNSGINAIDVSAFVKAKNSLFGPTEGWMKVDVGSGNLFETASGLAALADNGCAIMAGAEGHKVCVQTHAIQAGSAALDAGILEPMSLAFDQRGISARNSGPQPDIGAFEVQAIPSSAGECDGVAGINTSDVTCTINKVLMNP